LTFATGSEFAKLLDIVPTRPMRRRLVRCVAALHFLEGSPPTYLYTSGRPGRCNPRGVDCLYFSETERVAVLEYRRRFASVSAATEPRLMFFAQVDLKRVVDLSRIVKNLDAQCTRRIGQLFVPASASRGTRAGPYHREDRGIVRDVNPPPPAPTAVRLSARCKWLYHSPYA
jgi:RES domain